MTPDQAKASYRRMLSAIGETITLRTNDFETGTTHTQVLARVTGFAPDELVAGIDQGDRKVIVLADDVPASLAPKEGDQIVLRPGTGEQRTITVSHVDDSTRRVAGVLIAYELTARGA